MLPFSTFLFSDKLEGVFAIPNGLAIPSTPLFMIDTDNMAFFSLVV